MLVAAWAIVPAGGEEKPGKSVKIGEQDAQMPAKVRFDFRGGGLQGWRIAQGQPPEPVRGVEGNRYLSTRAVGSLGPGDMTLSAQGIRAVIESPVFRVEGKEATFRLGGFSKDKSAFVTLCGLDGRELKRAVPTGKRGDTGKFKPGHWKLDGLAGKRVFLRLVDQAGGRGVGYVELDEFVVGGVIDREATAARRRTQEKRRAAAFGPLKKKLDEAGKLVFAVREPGKNGHWYANFGHWATRPDYKMYGKGGRLCVLDLRSGEVETLIDDPEGGVRDPRVHYDGKTILFSYRPGGTEYHHLYEIGSNGSGLRQLTDGPYDDIEPSYLPDGRIVFCSSRCKRWVPCHWVEVATLHTCDGDGSGIRAISANVEHENTPWPLPDGRILYTRWEYIDRSVTQFHHLWTSNPDGTGQMIYFGNMHPGGLFIDAKPVPGTASIVFLNSPGHGRVEHGGTVSLVEAPAGPDDPSQIRPVSWTDNHRDPLPVGKAGFLSALGSEVVMLSPDGDLEQLHALSGADREAGLWCHEPRLLAARPREQVIPDRTEPESDSGEVMLADIYRGRNLPGVERGEIERLLVLEVLPKSLNASYGPEPIASGGAHNLERVLGTIPVEADGSTYAEMPAGRALLFVALDGEDREVKRMHSFLTVQPGEVVGCVGCHEQRTQAPRSFYDSSLLALAREPSKIRPIPGVPEVIDFPRDIQPILDRHCVACHDDEATARGGPRAGGVNLSGDRGVVYSHSYVSLYSGHGLVRVAGNGVGNSLPRTTGSGREASRLLDYLGGSHYEACLGDEERNLVRVWLDVGAPFPGTNAAEDSGMFRRFIDRLIEKDQKTEFGPRLPGKIPSAAAVYERRCNSCHRGGKELAVDPADNQGGREWGLGPGGPRRKYSRHMIFNLSQPERSPLLLAPLAKGAGGYGICRGRGGVGKPVFASRDDPDYHELLKVVRRSKEILETITRFDMDDFVPSEHYVREMKRYGFLDPGWKAGDSIDVYALDRAYWESFWPAAPDGKE